MAYPNQDQIEQAAQQYGVDQALVYAFAAMRGYAPQNASDVASFQQQISGWAPLLGVDQEYVKAFVTANGFLPQGGQFQQWMQSQGFTNGQGQLTGVAPYPGQGYPPGGASVTPVTPTPGNNIVPGPTQAQANLSGVGAAANGAVQTATDWVRQNEKTIVVGVVAVGGYYLGIWQGLLKGLRGRGRY